MSEPGARSSGRQRQPKRSYSPELSVKEREKPPAKAKAKVVAPHRQPPPTISHAALTAKAKAIVQLQPKLEEPLESLVNNADLTSEQKSSALDTMLKQQQARAAAAQQPRAAMAEPEAAGDTAAGETAEATEATGRAVVGAGEPAARDEQAAGSEAGGAGAGGAAAACMGIRRAAEPARAGAPAGEAAAPAPA